MIKMYSCKT